MCDDITGPILQRKIVRDPEKFQVRIFPQVNPENDNKILLN